MNTENQTLEGAKDVAASYPSQDLTAILLSSIAYCSLTSNVQSTLNSYLPDWQLVWAPEQEIGGNYAFLAKNGSSYVLAVRGSILNFSMAAVDDWFEQDFNVFKQVDWDYPYNATTKPMISAGANDGLNNLLQMTDTNQQNIFQYIQSNVTSRDTLMVTGHSLGGGLAPVCALYLNNKLTVANSSMPAMEVVTFAGPTTGNAGFATQFNAVFPGNACRRYMDTLDIIPYGAADVEGMALFYDGRTSSDPKASNVPFLNETLADFFLETGAAILVSEIAYGSYYTPLDGAIILNPGRIIFPNTEPTPFKAWGAQAGAQHSHDNYLMMLGWTGGAFACTNQLADVKKS